MSPIDVEKTILNYAISLPVVFLYFAVDAGLRGIRLIDHLPQIIMITVYVGSAATILDIFRAHRNKNGH